MKKKLLFLVTEDWYFWSHRLELARAARKRGFDVTVVTCVNEYGKRIIAEGFRLLPIKMNRSGKNPFKELLSVLEISDIYKREKPDIVYHVALKPVLYGSWAAALAKVPHVVNTLGGLGHFFTVSGITENIIRIVVKIALRTALKKKNTVTIMQNPDDRSVLLDNDLLNIDDSMIIKGVGVDTELYSPPVEEPEGPPVILLASRMLWTKGVGEFVEASRILNKDEMQARMVLAGTPDLHNPASIPVGKIKEWQDDGCVEYWGGVDDMPSALRKASVVVLPSYREGLPKVLVEGASSGRALVSFNVPGCREIVRDGVNGILVPFSDVNGLANAIKKLVKDPFLRKEMGRRGREIVLQEFSCDVVLAQTISLFERIVSAG